jgi:hypothetical protein
LPLNPLDEFGKRVVMRKNHLLLPSRQRLAGNHLVVLMLGHFQVLPDRAVPTRFVVWLLDGLVHQLSPRFHKMVPVLLMQPLCRENGAE